MKPATECNRFMYIGYIDDSGSTGSNCQDRDSRFQVIGGPIIYERLYVAGEFSVASWKHELGMEGDEWASFEFHACDMFHCNGAFEKLGREHCRDLLAGALKWLRHVEAPIIYGAVDKSELSKRVYRSANPVDIAFSLYLASLDKWLEAKGEEVVDSFPDNPTDQDTERIPVGVLIADDSGKRKDIRHTIEESYRRHRRENVSRWLTLWDDVYFGNSSHSLGIQLADICAYFIARHLAGKADAEGFYNIIKDQICEPQIFPASSGPRIGEEK
jgi:hypothetical protein